MVTQCFLAIVKEHRLFIFCTSSWFGFVWSPNRVGAVISQKRYHVTFTAFYQQMHDANCPTYQPWTLARFLCVAVNFASACPHLEGPSRLCSCPVFHQTLNQQSQLPCCFLEIVVAEVVAKSIASVIIFCWPCCCPVHVSFYVFECMFVFNYNKW